MNWLKKLAFAAAFALIMVLCAFALAEEDTVELTLHMIDPVADRKAGGNVFLAHGECLEWGHWGGKRECDCFICPCGEEWRHDDFSAARQDRRSENFDKTTTVTVKKGHMYRCYAYCGYDHVPLGSDHMQLISYVVDYTGDSIVIYEENDETKTNINTNGKNELTFAYEPLYTPASYTFEGAVTLDGCIPEDGAFGFHVWELTREQKEAIFNQEGLVTPENFPEIPLGAWDPDWIPTEEEQEFMLRFTEKELPRRVAKLIRQRLQDFPVTDTIYSQGDKISYTTREFTFYDLEQGYPGSKYGEFFYVIAAAPTPCDPVCYDESVFGFGLFVQGFNPPTPVDDAYAVTVSQRPLSMYFFDFEAFSPEYGFVEMNDIQSLKEGLRFAHRICPFYNPGEPEAPAVPQTGDNSPIMLWLALVCVSGMALLNFKRKKA